MHNRPSPWRLTGYAAAQFFLFPAVLLLVVLVVVSGVLAVVTVGVPLLLLTVPGLRGLANVHRTMAAKTLGHPVPEERMSTDGLSPLAKIRVWATDPMTWREIAWALVIAPIGWVLSLLTIVLLLPVVTGAIWWFGAPHIMWARAMLDRAFLTKGHSERLEERVEVLTESRAASVDHAAAELRRIERDLHDGAQARLVALGMTLGMAEQLVRDDPEAATKLLMEARETSTAALGDLRFVVRGIHPRCWLTGVSAGPSRRSRSTWRSRSRCTARSRTDSRIPSSRPSTSPWPSAWPTWASTRERRRAG